MRSATRGAHTRTPLQSAVANLVMVLIVGAALICLILAWVRLQQGHGLLDALLSAVTLAVAALPEEFPIVLTFFLGVGVYRLAKRQALVRRAVVVENIGRVSCICSDKTGTITEGRLQLTHRSPAADVSAERLLLLAAGASRRETGDPMDAAILDALPEAPAWEVVACFPFTEDRKRETGVLRQDQRLFAAVKGAPEIVLGQCNLAPEERQTWQARIDEFAGSGHKVIACAWRELDGTPWPGGEPDRDFRFAGLLCFEDPVRQGVAEALQVCAQARIHVIMVTGDHRATASAVAREIGLGGPDPLVLDADQMHARLAQGDSSFLREVSVIARAVPSQKVDLVRALQANGEIVAVTGDGVNDVPALQAADIGIAMGERGTRSAREVAAIVLLDDNFRTIVRAIAEGRQVFYNLQLSFQYLLMIHLPLVVTAALIPLAGYPLLYLPIHVVWLELIIHPTALLVFQDLPSDHRLAPATRGTPAPVLQSSPMAHHRRRSHLGYGWDHRRLPAQSGRWLRHRTRTRHGPGAAHRGKRRDHRLPEPAAQLRRPRHGGRHDGPVSAPGTDARASNAASSQAFAQGRLAAGRRRWLAGRTALGGEFHSARSRPNRA